MIKTRPKAKEFIATQLHEKVQIATRQLLWLCDAGSRALDTDQESIDVFQAEITKMLDCFRFDDLLVDVQIDHNAYVCRVMCAARVDGSNWVLFAAAFTPPH